MLTMSFINSHMQVEEDMCITETRELQVLRLVVGKLHTYVGRYLEHLKSWRNKMLRPLKLVPADVKAPHITSIEYM